MDGSPAVIPQSLLEDGQAMVHGCLARMICRLYICGRMASCTAESAGVRYPIRRIMRCAGKGPMPTAMSVASVPKEKSTTTDEQKDPGLRYAAWGLSFLTKNAARVGHVCQGLLCGPVPGSLSLAKENLSTLVPRCPKQATTQFVSHNSNPFQRNSFAQARIKHA